MKETILQKLADIEQQYGVTILYACESGSRAWGFASPDSDYDVRFLYVHPRDAYLAIHDPRDVIEFSDGGVLDISGWDIKKALHLLYKANAPLREWLTSPVVYRCDDAAMPPIFELMRDTFLPAPLCHHYLGMTTKRLMLIEETGEATGKAYLYALRTLFCCQWILRHNSQPPMVFDELLMEFLPDVRNELRQEIDRLLAAKKAGNEKTGIPRSKRLEQYLHAELQAAKTSLPPNLPPLDVERFNQVFQRVLA
ncbi:nucleotidyltransferase, predicted [Candidatus Moduliflexus flocculans]|uniref:Nucleotidyltransferase, predicted n=1 Tax=Candidatus Moduliflexus flocculans TaxID=1499966 RepID=A0A0S6W1B0_9BACT|nr:nucleotidyltransferase, predicted [Candidatus Moduliflexus flocculans]